MSDFSKTPLTEYDHKALFEWSPSIDEKVCELEQQLADAHTLLDQDGVQIIRNHKDGYPEGRPNVEMTLVERVKAVCRMVHDWHRWHNDLEAQLADRDERIKELEDFVLELGKTLGANDGFGTEYFKTRCQQLMSTPTIPKKFA